MIPLSDENRLRHAPVASRTLILICIGIFAWQSFERPWGQLAIPALGFTPAYFFAGGHPDPALAWVPFSVTILSYMFLHAGWLHLAMNMLCLWVFGDDVEESLGQPGFIVFYLCCGVAAALAQSTVDTASVEPVVGASGAVSGLLGAYLLLYPRSHVNVLVPIFIIWDVVRLPAYVVLLFWFAVQLLYDFAGPQAGAHVAFRAHLGGFVAGLILAPLFMLVIGPSRARVAARGQRLLR